ncbi:MAG: hybrid sensor histidine kinase/response regulator [Campylobacterota bacterium]|nr:hybrid sensor histidine kinase/response regulator [Campylobacterota bacterium]
MRSKTILAIDDTVSNLDILVDYLSDYDVIDTTDGYDALDIIKEQNIDLILLDIEMPDINGFEVCKKLKQDPKTKNIPVIFITAKSDEDSLEHAYEIGGVDYVTKPFRKKELRSRINTHLTLNDYTKTLEEKVQEETAKRLEQQEILVRQSRVAAMGEMMSAITHQWKQPLSVISLVSSTISMKLEYGLLSDDKLKSYMNSIENASNFMDETINDFKNYFNKDKTRVIFEVKNEVDKIVKMLNKQLETNLIEVDVSIEDDVKGYGVTSEFKHVILNLISNAKDAIIQNDTEKRVITVSAQTIDDKTSTLVVKDTGGGIPDNIVDNVFDDYFSTKGENGTGIGLSMTKLIVEDEMKGQISVCNDNEGAVFSVKFPNIEI